MAEQLVTAADANYSWGGKIGGGLVAGLLAATLWMGFMMAYSSAIGDGPTMPLRALGALVYGIEALVAGTIAMVAGAGIQLGFSIVLGIFFGLAMSRRTSLVLATLLGILVGIAIWLGMNLYVLPFMDPTMAARVALMPIGYFIAHVLFGIGLGMTPLFIRAFTRGRGQETQRIDRPSEPLLT